MHLLPLQLLPKKLLLFPVKTNYQLVNKLAKNTDYGIILIGQDYDKTLEKSKVLKNNNVYYLGRKDYTELPKYGCNVDVLVIPFLINDITEATSPVKIFEYMAMQKPIVTTDLPECRQYKSVLISKSHEDFIKNIEKAINLKEDNKYIKVEINEAKENDWKEKAASLIRYIDVEKKRFIDYVLDFEYNKIGIKEPDNVIFLHAPFDLVTCLRKARITNEGVSNDIHEKDLTFMRKVYDSALFVADYLSWDKVECSIYNKMKSVEEIHDEVYKLIKK